MLPAGRGLQPACDVHSDTGGVEVGREVGRHGARQNLAEWMPTRIGGFSSAGLDRGLHGQPRAAGAHGMVFLRVGVPNSAMMPSP